MICVLLPINPSPPVDKCQDCDMCTITYKHHSMFQKGWFACLNCDFLYCISWFTVDLIFRIVRFCPCPSYFYFPFGFPAIHLIKGINKIFTLFFFNWKKIETILSLLRLKIQIKNLNDEDNKRKKYIANQIRPAFISIHMDHTNTLFRTMFLYVIVLSLKSAIQ